MPGPAFALLVVVLGQQAGLPQVQVEPLEIDLAAWKAGPKVAMTVTEDGKATVYAGVPLRKVLEETLKGKPEMQGLRSVSDAVLLVKAADGYQAAVAAAEAAMDPKGERLILALERDGQPLAEGQGPLRLVVRDDPQRVRWVRMVRAITLVRLPKLDLPHPVP